MGLVPDPISLDAIDSEALRSMLRLDSFYPELSPEKVRSLFPTSGLYSFQEREAVIRQGTASRNLYLLLTGSVRVSRREGAAAKELAILHAPDIIGEIALLKPDAIRTADVDTLCRSRIYRLTCEDVKRIFQATPDLGNHLVALARERLAR